MWRMSKKYFGFQDTLWGHGIIITFNSIYVCVCVSGYHVYAGVNKDQKRASDPLELELHSYEPLMWGLGTKGSARSRSALNH